MRKTTSMIIGLFLLLLSMAGVAQQKQDQSKTTATGASKDARLQGDKNDRKNTGAQEDADYRDNRVSGNPNNITTDEGSNRKTSSGRETNESSASTSSADGDSATTSSGSADPETSNVPAVIQETTSGSGSPAVLSEESERDGTNNMQRAKPNMAGADVKGLHYGKGKDSDKEMRKGTVNNSQKGARQRTAHSNNPHPRDMGTLPDQKVTDQSDQEGPGSTAGSENKDISEKQNHEQMMNDEGSSKPQDKKKKKRWFKRG